jgi:hypothetical protein
MIPCRRDKCVLLPVCRQKQKINCSILFSYINSDQPRKLEVFAFFSKTNYINTEDDDFCIPYNRFRYTMLKLPKSIDDQEEPNERY